MLGRRTRGRHAGCFGIVAAGAAGPQRLGTIVKVTRGRGSLHHEVEDRRAAHHLDGSFERKIGETLSIAPDYHIAGLQTRRSRGTALPRALKDSLFINKTVPFAYFAQDAQFSKRRILNVRVRNRQTLLFY